VDHYRNWLASLFGKNGGALWYALRRSREAASEEEVALRAWYCGMRARIDRECVWFSGGSVPDGRNASSVGMERRNASGVEAACLHGWVFGQRTSWVTRNGSEEPLPVTDICCAHATQPVLIDWREAGGRLMVRKVRGLIRIRSAKLRSEVQNLSAILRVLRCVQRNGFTSENGFP
jgi:hypothetical protein